MKESLLVIGAGDVGGYLAWNVERFGLPYEVQGFLDDDPAKAGRTLYGKPVLGPVEAIEEHEGSAVVVGIAAPRIRRRIAEQVAAHTDHFPSIVAPTAWVSEGVEVGAGVILYPGVSVNYETVIGDFCILNMNCAIGHNCTIEPCSTLAPGVNFAGFTHVEPEVDVGIGASTRQRVRIGTGAVIGGQSMVLSDVPPGTTVVGAPARPIKERPAGGHE